MSYLGNVIFPHGMDGNFYHHVFDVKKGCTNFVDYDDEIQGIIDTLTSPSML